MAYNYSYQTYPYSLQTYPYSPQTYAPQQAQNAQPNNNFIWVQGESGAKSYLVAPNQTVTLWDTESHTIYIKSADSMGMPTMKVLDYTLRDAPQTGQILQQSEYATRSDVESLREEISALRAKFEIGGINDEH